ncbi:hypothetical protein DLD77_08745 [Chitinophaga alhagiae]|uniref:Uncharacterized protein n=1 Tax=Chitinophaga alhagiae TaxID=2203219 RepID=A0ABN5LQT7_9BACT|nr:hypothetical protein DLD77_08745 [Chitinophaga alhagiae]
MSGRQTRWKYRGKNRQKAIIPDDVRQADPMEIQGEEPAEGDYTGRCPTGRPGGNTGGRTGRRRLYRTMSGRQTRWKYGKNRQKTIKPDDVRQADPMEIREEPAEGDTSAGCLGDGL